MGFKGRSQYLLKIVGKNFTAYFQRFVGSIVLNFCNTYINWMYHPAAETCANKNNY
jgi:hypothetical protein